MQHFPKGAGKEQGFKACSIEVHTLKLWRNSVCTRMSDFGFSVFGGRYCDEHHGNVIWSVLFAQSKEVFHPEEKSEVSISTGDK